ncbi:recombinase RecA [Vibrio mediterranei]|uniref:recombinase RecA n=1 Tax=Vibrio mediterranei TaxID=689 RepID=UPI004068F1E2
MSVQTNSQSLEQAIAKINKMFGPGSTQRNCTIDPSIESFSSGSLSLDIALGVGGFAKHKIHELYGEPGAGKSTLVLMTIAAAQRDGAVVAFINAEHTFQPDYAKSLGVNLDELIINEPSFGEEALTVIATLAESCAVDLIICDSAAALVPKIELTSNEEVPGVMSRMLSAGLRKINTLTAQTNTTVIFTNQMRHNMSIVAPREVSACGNALKFYAATRTDLRISKVIKKGEDTLGINIRAKVEKNKLAAPFKEATSQIVFGRGINLLFELVTLGLKVDVIEQSDSEYSFEGKLLGKGLSNSMRALSNNPELKEKLKNTILSQVSQ